MTAAMQHQRGNAPAPVEGATLRQLLASHARTRPSAPALLAPGHRTITYVELLAVVSRARRWLLSCGLGSHARVALLLPQGMELAIASLAVGSQATAIALHPGSTQAELAALLADARTDAVLGLPGDPAAARLGQQLGSTPLSLDLERLLAAPHESPVAFDDDRDWPAPEDTAFVLFTSGTTGRPKRVPLTQGQVLASARNIARHLALAPDDRGLGLMPLFHSHGLVGGLLASLAAGSSVICTPGFDASQFLRWIGEFRPTWYTAAPTLHRAIAELGTHAEGALPPHKLRFIRSASSALPAELLRGLEALWGVPVIESYGMTESATQLASNPLPPGMRKPASVGRPAGAELRVIDESGNDQATGLPGSIVARGPAVFAGYEDAPAANAEAFRDGWFITGDIGWFDADGYLHIVGRNAEIINRGGEKIAPSDVEQALLRLPAVVQAVAYPAPHPTLGEDVHAAVVLARDAVADPQALRTALFGTIADFKIPARIHVLDDIPAGVGGKVQRRRLHEAIARIDLASPSAAAPLTAMEARVAALFARVLDRAVDEVDANFLVLGGDSLSAARLAQMANEAWGIEMSASAVLAAPTVGGFAARVQAAIDEADALGDALQAEMDALSDEEVARLLGPQ